MAPFKVGLYVLNAGVFGDRALAGLREVLSEAEVGVPDELGIVEIALEADDREAALRRVWDAIALAGADDELVFAEHPELPGHWRYVRRGWAEGPEGPA